MRVFSLLILHKKKVIMPLSDSNLFPMKSVFLLSSFAKATEMLQPVLMLMTHNIYAV